MSTQKRTDKISIATLSGVLMVLVAFLFQLYAISFEEKNVNLPDMDSITCSIQVDGPIEVSKTENEEEFQFFFIHTRTRQYIAFHENQILIHHVGRANTPHLYQARYILFENPKIDC